MSIQLNQIIGTNNALFENDDIPGQDNGDIVWDNLEETGPNYFEMNVSGYDVQGNAISTTPCEGQINGDVNPTKVFLLIARVLKKTLCPTCS
jgi:hypothetical protein